MLLRNEYSISLNRELLCVMILAGAILSRRYPPVIQGLYTPKDAEGRFWFLKAIVELARFREKRKGNS